MPRRLCSPSACDPRQWFGPIEHTSTKAKATMASYRSGGGLAGRAEQTLGCISLGSATR